MSQHFTTLGYNLLVLLHGSDAIADAEDGQHAEEGEHLLQEGLAEDVGTGHEDGATVHRTQDDQGVEQCAGVVAADDDGSILGEVFFASNRQTAHR